MKNFIFIISIDLFCLCRSKVTSMLLPRLEKFNADLIFISAGFDAHYDDFYHFLTEHDLHWVTEQLCAVADRSGTFGSGDSSCGDQTQQQQGSSGGGPRRCGVISVLEGGYSLSSPLPKAKATRAVAVASTTSSAAPTAAPASVATGAMGGVATGGPASAAAQPVVESSLFSLDTTSAVAATSSAGGASAGMVTSPSGTDSVGSVLGRGGRLKAKKEKAATGAPRLVTYATVVSGPAVSGSTVAAEAVSSGPGTSVVSPGLKGPAVVAGPSVGAKALFPPGPVAAAHGADNSSPAGATMNTMFAQRPGDGGLVKG